jgi:acetamidase/formamidase
MEKVFIKARDTAVGFVGSIRESRRASKVSQASIDGLRIGSIGSPSPNKMHSISSNTAFHIHQHHIHQTWNKDHPPQLTVSSGDVVTFDCKDASNGQIRRDSTVGDLDTFKTELADPVFGPVFVREAEPGDALEVEVVKLEHADWGWSALVPGFGLLADEFLEEGPQLKIWQIPSGAEVLKFNDRISIPIRPFLGTMGVAPSMNGDHPTIPPLETGGNIDCRHITQGSRLILPVRVPGALFSCGDGHAAQGDGEVCGVAVEVGMKATLRFNLIKSQKHVATPHYRCPPQPTPVLPDAGTYSTLGIDSDMLEATRKAVRAMIGYLVAERDLSRAEAYMLCSVAVDLKMAEVVDMPNYAISATIPMNIFGDLK